MKKIIKNLLLKEIIKNLLFVVIVLIVLSVCISSWLNNYTRHGESVEIPNVKSMKLEAAKLLFDAQELSYQVIDSTYNKAFKPGTIIETIPPIGSKVKKGRTIYIRLNSHSAGMVSIPDLRDLSQRQATAMLKALGLNNINVKLVQGIYRDLVVGLEYRGRSLQIKDKVPMNATVTLLVTSGNAASYQDEFTNEVRVSTEDMNEDADNPFDF